MSRWSRATARWRVSPPRQPGEGDYDLGRGTVGLRRHEKKHGLRGRYARPYLRVATLRESYPRPAPPGPVRWHTQQARLWTPGRPAEPPVADRVAGVGHVRRAADHAGQPGVEAPQRHFRRPCQPRAGPPRWAQRGRPILSDASAGRRRCVGRLAHARQPFLPSI